MAQTLKNLPAMWENQVQFLEKGMATVSIVLPGEFHGQRNLAGYSPWTEKSQTRLSDQHLYSQTTVGDLATEVFLIPGFAFILSLLAQAYGCSKESEELRSHLLQDLSLNAVERC